MKSFSKLPHKFPYYSISNYINVNLYSRCLSYFDIHIITFDNIFIDFLNSMTKHLEDRSNDKKVHQK